MTEITVSGLPAPTEPWDIELHERDDRDQDHADHVAAYSDHLPAYNNALAPLTRPSA